MLAFTQYALVIIILGEWDWAVEVWATGKKSRANSSGFCFQFVSSLPYYYRQSCVARAVLLVFFLVLQHMICVLVPLAIADDGTWDSISPPMAPWQLLSLLPASGTRNLTETATAILASSLSPLQKANGRNGQLHVVTHR